MEMQWVPVEEKQPKPGENVLVSFGNCPVLDIGRYEADDEGGAFYPAESDNPYNSFGAIANAWMPLPERYTGQKSMIKVEKTGKNTCIEDAMQYIKGYCNKHIECAPEGTASCRLYDEENGCCFLCNQVIPADWTIDGEDGNDE